MMAHSRMCIHLANILRLLKRVGFFDTFGPKWLFPSVQSAVEFAKAGNKVVSNGSNIYTQCMGITHVRMHARTHARTHTHTHTHMPTFNSPCTDKLISTCIYYVQYLFACPHPQRSEFLQGALDLRLLTWLEQQVNTEQRVEVGDAVSATSLEPLCHGWVMSPYIHGHTHHFLYPHTDIG